MDCFETTHTEGKENNSKKLQKQKRSVITLLFKPEHSRTQRLLLNFNNTSSLSRLQGSSHLLEISQGSCVLKLYGLEAK